MKRIKKLYTLLLCLTLLFSLSLPVFASQAESESQEQVEWVISDDQMTLTDGETVYQRYNLYSYARFRPYDFYEYSQSIETDNPYVDIIGHPAHAIEGKVTVNHDVAVVFDYYSDSSEFLVYVTADGAAALDAFVAGTYSRYELAESRYFSAPVEADLAEALQGKSSDGVMDARELGDLAYYEVYGYDSTWTFVHVVGAVFDNEGQYLYVNYDNLDNSFFDAYGNLSFRNGNVPVYTLNAAEANEIAAAVEELGPYSANVTGEEAELLEATPSILLFLALASPLLYLLPIGLMVLGIVMSSIKKIPNRKRWRLVILLAAIWLGLAILASCALLIPTFFL